MRGGTAEEPEAGAGKRPKAAQILHDGDARGQKAGMGGAGWIPGIVHIVEINPRQCRL